MKLYLVRHAQSANNANVDHPSMRQPDPPLTEMGHMQAQLLAEYFLGAVEPDRVSDTLAWRFGEFDQLSFKPTQVLCSPMYRSLQTANHISHLLKIPVSVWPNLCERGGLFQYVRGNPEGLPGMNREAILSEFPDYILPTQITRSGWWRGGLESRNASRLRAMEVMMSLQAKAQTEWENEEIILVSHAGFMDSLMKAFLTGMHPDIDDRHVYFFYNTSVTRIDFLHEGELGIRYLNRISHLPTELVS